ncbi:unnamed protein product [Discosporangium mesarthrocarpum]
MPTYNFPVRWETTCSRCGIQLKIGMHMQADKHTRRRWSNKRCYPACPPITNTPVSSGAKERPRAAQGEPVVVPLGSPSKPKSLGTFCHQCFGKLDLIHDEYSARFRSGNVSNLLCNDCSSFPGHARVLQDTVSCATGKRGCAVDLTGDSDQDSGCYEQPVQRSKTRQASPARGDDGGSGAKDVVGDNDDIVFVASLSPEEVLEKNLATALQRGEVEELS